MEPETIRQEEEERALLRSKHYKAVSGLLKALESEPKAAYSGDDLNELRVSLALNDYEDPVFLESKACLFKPMSPEEFEEFSLNESELSEFYYHTDFDNLFDKPTTCVTDPSPSYWMFTRAKQIYRCLEIYHPRLLKKSGRGISGLWEFDGWTGIRDGNSFLDGPMGLFLGYVRGVPNWRVQTTREWRDEYDLSKTTSPHIMFVTCTGKAAREDELLFGELGPIAQAIQNRLEQKEFEKTSHFPVLAISFFGPRHGRILQAKFNKSGVLEVQASSIYSFRHKAEAPFDLFLRYYICEPQDGPDDEFYSDKEEVSDQTPQYVSPCPESEKENILPKMMMFCLPRSYETYTSLC